MTHLRLIDCRPNASNDERLDFAASMRRREELRTREPYKLGHVWLKGGFVVDEFGNENWVHGRWVPEKTTTRKRKKK